MDVIRARAQLNAVHIHKDGSIEDLGKLSERLVTTAAVNYIVDSFQDSTTYPLHNFKYHGSGTTNTAEAITDTTLAAEVGARGTGSLGEGTAANIFKTIGTVSYTDTYAIVEHGVFSASSDGTLLDRSIFSAINVVSGDSIVFSYTLSVTAGG